MTEQQRTDELHKIGNLIKRLLPDFQGFVQFNLKKDKDGVIITRHETLVKETI